MMRLRVAMLAPLAMILSGCWEAKAALMPVAARDLLPIEGRYNVLPVSKGEFVLVTLIRDRQYSVAGKPQSGTETPSLISFDEIEQLPTIAPTLARKSRIFIAQSMELEGGKPHYYYSLVQVDRSDDRFLQILNLTTLCSDTVRTIVGAAQGGDCIFADYAQVQTAAIDAVRWMNDARVQLDSVVYVRPES